MLVHLSLGDTLSVAEQNNIDVREKNKPFPLKSFKVRPLVSISEIRQK